MSVHRDLRLYASVLEPGDEVTHRFAADRHGWLQIVRGEIATNGERLVEGDGVALSGLPELTLRAEADAELLLFDLA